MSGTRGAYHDAAEREIACWPGVTFRFEHARGKGHPRIVLGFNGRERFVTFPGTPSDSVRGPANFVTDLRKALRALGAVRSEREAARQVVRQRRGRPTPVCVAIPTITDPRSGGFGVLRDWRPRADASVAHEPPAPAKRSWFDCLFGRAERTP